MSDALEQGLGVFASVLQEIKESSIEIMRVHPVNGLLMMNLLGNIGYVLFAVPYVRGDEEFYLMNQWGLMGQAGEQKFRDKTEMMSYVFRQVGANAGALLDAQTVASLFQVFNLSKLAALVKG